MSCKVFLFRLFVLFNGVGTSVSRCYTSALTTLYFTFSICQPLPLPPLHPFSKFTHQEKFCRKTADNTDLLVRCDITVLGPSACPTTQLFKHTRKSS